MDAAAAPRARRRGVPRMIHRTPATPANRAALTRALAAALAADVRDFPTLPVASGGSPSGNTRSVVGRLHPPLAAASSS